MWAADIVDEGVKALVVVTLICDAVDGSRHQRRNARN